MFEWIKYSHLKTILSILTFIFVGTLFLSLFHISTDMSMTNHTHGCPMLMEAGAICQMDYNEHLAIWLGVSLATPLLLLILLLLPFVKMVLPVSELWFRQRLLVSISPVFHNHLKQRPNHTVRNLQELFSGGVLHPKLYHFVYTTV